MRYRVVIAALVLIAGSPHANSAPAVSTSEADFAHIMATQPCRLPQQLRVAGVDPRFRVRRADVEKALRGAIELWERALRRPVFAIGDGAGIDVRLVYDQRQQVADTTRVLQQQAEVSKDRLGLLRQDFESRRIAYETAAQRFNQSTAAFQRELDDFNDAIARWERDPGTDSERSLLLARQRQLRSRQDSLQRDLRLLRQQEQSLQTTRDTINRMVDDHNSRINEANGALRALPQSFAQLGVTEVSAGRIRIDIFQFLNLTQLRTIFAHELGHALGVAHSGDARSIMYPGWNGSDVLSVQRADREQVSRRCR